MPMEVTFVWEKMEEWSSSVSVCNAVAKELMYVMGQLSDAPNLPQTKEKR